MGAEIYSATVFQVFFWGLVWGLLSIIFAVLALLYGIFAREEKTSRRIWAVALAVLFLLVGLKSLTYQWAAMKEEPGRTTALVERLDIVDPDDNCTAYALKTTVRQESVIFFVPKRAFKQVRVGGCYSFTYHTMETIASLEFLGMKGACYVTRIVAEDDTACR